MDIPTLYIVFGGVLMASSVALIIAWRENPHDAGQRSWALGASAGAFAVLIFAGTSVSHDLFWLNAIVNPVAWGAILLFARGVREYVGLVPTPRWMLVFYAIASTLPLAVLALSSNERGLTITIGSLVTSLFCFDVVVVLLRPSTKKSPASYFLVFFFSLWGITHVVRALMTAFDIGHPIYERPIDKIMLLVGVLGAATTAMGFAMLTTRRLRDARARNLDELEHSVEHLQQQFAKLAAGDYSARAEARGNSSHMDAIAELFNETVGQLREAQAQLQMSDRLAAMGTVAAGVAHEINNPLSFVSSNVEFALEELEASGGSVDAEGLEELLEALRAAEVGSERIRKIVLDLKRLTRSADDETDNVDVNKLVRSAASMLENEVRHHARLELQLGQVGTVAGEDARLGQVFLNLIHNAAQAIPPGHASENLIAVSTKQDERGVVVEVRDTGSGISEDVQSRIFEAFFTTKAVGVGTGLGLAICHRVVTEVGGTIEVESEPGAGSLFRVVLPPGGVKVGEEASESIAPVPRPVAARRVLVIDDEVEVAHSASRILGKQHSVDVVSNARDGLAHILEHDYDLILCDLMMPEMTGMELYGELESSHPELAARVLFMTGGVFSPDAEAFVEANGERIIAKPLDSAALRRLVGRGRAAGGGISSVDELGSGDSQ